MAIYVGVHLQVLSEVRFDDTGACYIAFPELVVHSLQYDHGSSPHRAGLCDFTGVVTLRRHFGHAKFALSALVVHFYNFAVVVVLLATLWARRFVLSELIVRLCSFVVSVPSVG